MSFSGFTGLVVADMNARFSVGDKLTHKDFTEIAKANGETIKAVSHILRHQAEYGNLKKLHTRFTVPGAFRIRVYEVCENEKFADTKPDECANNLQNAMFNWGAK